MPHINRIRVNNVKYNFGTQFYDDFIMRFSGKNTIYDLANGGGKSVLMLLLLQNMIPNCTLDDKQPIEKLFRTGNGSNTIHSLVEWKLSDVHIKNNYKYMLTGFCARKARDEDKSDENSASIDYFNYVIFYREYNDNDIKNLPLSVPGSKNPNVKERITYQGLKNYLRDLERKDFNLEVKIFERKGDYQRFIARYGIYESEWEIIRGINKTEGHVRTYFESNYKTTRKVVEDLLIEEIIEKSFKNRVLSADHVQSHENVMVETLIEIKDKLLELSARKDEIQNYDRQVDLLESFAERIAGMKKLYFGQENLEKELVAGYYSLQDVVSENQQKQNSIEVKIGEIQQKITEEQKSIDTVQIQENEKELCRLWEILEQIQQEEETIENEQEKLQQELITAESMNDYLDYVYYKKERDAIRENLERRTSDKGTLLKELTELAAEKKIRNQYALSELQKKLEEEQEKNKREQETIKELQKRQEELTKEKNISEYKITEFEQKLNQGNEGIASLKQQVNLLLVYDLAKELKLAEEQIREQERTLEKTQESVRDNFNRKQELESKIELIQGEIKDCENRMESNLERRMELASEKTRIEKLKTVYGASDVEKLYEVLQNKQQQAIQLKADNQKEKSAKEDLSYRLSEGNPIAGSPEIIMVLEYIQRFHTEQVLLGSDVLKEEEPQKRQALLERVPMLPYAVVIKEKYGQISNDTGLQTLALGNYMVPLLDWRAIENEDYFTMDTISYAMCRKELFYDEKVLAAEKSKLDNEILELERQLEILLDNITVYSQDLEFIKLYISEYQYELEQLEAEYGQLRLLIKEYEIEGRQAKDEWKYCAEAQEMLESESLVAENRRKDICTRKATIEEIIKLSEQVKEVENILRVEYENQKSVSKELNNITERGNAWSLKENANQKRMEVLKEREVEIQTQWENYRRYYREDAEVENQFQELSDEELEAKFRGAAEAFENEMGDLSDKQKLLENYEIAMEKSLQAIDYKGISVDDISVRYQTMECLETSKEELLAYKQKMEQKRKELKDVKARSRKVRSDRDKLEGAVNLGKATIIEKYGEYKTVEYSGMSAAMYIEERKRVIREIQEMATEMKNSLRVIGVEDKELQLLIHDLERVLTDSMKEKYRDERYDVTEALRGRVEEVLDSWSQFYKEIAERKDDFEKEKNQMIHTLNLMKCAPLADEIRKNVDMPHNSTETDVLADALKEIVDCLKLEKERIEKSILDMEAIKENFESQCIQSCINIRTELEKLPKLSRIVMDGESIPIISLNIPYIPEQEYKMRMEKYIDETVQQADDIKSETERVKFIKNQLSWKRLFAVIVSDMNGIRMNLYKRERMKEQSRYLKYEEAVGSTGQSQGIYIQFLIAVINYISSINSRDADSTSLLKTVFIDNPFGAAKDIYIWEPIFKMLKTNNVQLVVPCRGATPAITGRFDVNYVLGQKIVGGKQQTVVVDYFSNVESDKLDYTTMTYEQETLQFMQKV